MSRSPPTPSVSPVISRSVKRTSADPGLLTGTAVGGDLLIALGQNPGFAPLIADALTQNFTRDLDELQGKIKRAVDQRREGAFVIRTQIDGFEIGAIKAYGNGLYLPVRMVGGARVDYRPAR